MRGSHAGAWMVLLAICSLAGVIGYYHEEDKRVLQKLATATTQPNLVTIQNPLAESNSVGPIDLGSNRQLWFLDRGGASFAAVVLGNTTESIEAAEPYAHRGLARMLLCEHDKRQWWADESRDVKNGKLVYTFRLTTEEEYKRQEAALQH